MKAELLIDASGPDIRRRTSLHVPDPFFYIRDEKGVDTVFFDAREYEIQKIYLDKAANGVQIERWEPYIAAAANRSGPGSVLEKSLLEILDQKGITHVSVSPDLPYSWVKILESGGKTIGIYDFASERSIKTEKEFVCMKEAQAVTDAAFAYAKQILSESTIEADGLVWKGAPLTSEILKFEMESFYLRNNYNCPVEPPIVVAVKEQTARPHDEGSGRLLANEFILIDMFPQSRATGYFADMTRTFCKGTPTPEMVRIYDAVKEVQAEALAAIRVGVSCKSIHQLCIDGFAKRGFETSAEKGFMHGTGHALGLALHENPRFNASSPDVVEPGFALTVEPGLYYPGVGGVRLEDVIVVHHDGTVENITQFEKELIVA